MVTERSKMGESTLEPSLYDVLGLTSTARMKDVRSNSIQSQSPAKTRYARDVDAC